MKKAIIFKEGNLMNHRKTYTILFTFILSVFLFSSSTYGGFPVRLEKDVAFSAIDLQSAADMEVTFNLYDSETAIDPIATQTFLPGEWWAEYDFKKFKAGSSKSFDITQFSIARFKADFTNTDALTSDMELWVEIELDGAIVGERERLKSEAWALFSDDTKKLGNWESRIQNTVYYAETDGFIVGTLHVGTQDLGGTILTDSNNPPTTSRLQVHWGMLATPVCCPVKKGDYWMAFVNGPLHGSWTIFWIPLGN